MTFGPLGVKTTLIVRVQLAELIKQLFPRESAERAAEGERARRPPVAEAGREPASDGAGPCDARVPDAAAESGVPNHVDLSGNATCHCNTCHG